MRVPSFVSKLLKRKKAKPEQAPIDEYERAIIESPATPPESDSSVEAPGMCHMHREVIQPHMTP